MKSQNLIQHLPEFLLHLVCRLVDDGEEIGVLHDALVQPGDHPRDKLQGGVLHVGVEGRGRGGVVGGFVIAVSSSLRSGHESMTFLEGKHETV